MHRVCGFIAAVPTSSGSTLRSLCTSVLRTRRQPLLVSKRPYAGNKADLRQALKLREASVNHFIRIIKLAVPYRGRILLGFGFLGLGSSIFLLTPHVLGRIIDEFDEQKSKTATNDAALRAARYLKENPAALVGVLLCGAAAICGRTYCMHTAGQLIINDLRTKVFGKVLCHDIAFFDRNKVGEIVSRLSSDALIVGHAVSTNLSDGLRALVTIVGSAGLMVYTSPSLCAPMTVVIPVIVGTFMVFGKIQRKFTIRMQEAVAGTNNVATERLTHIRTIRTLVSENRELEAYRNKINVIWDVAKGEGLFKGLMFGTFQLTGYLSLTSMLFYGSHLISQGVLTYGELSSFSLYAVLCASGLGHLSTFFNELMKGLGASQRLFQLAAEEPQIPIVGGETITSMEQEIRFEDVGFCYPERDILFSELNFKIPAGKITAIVGPSGSGKSTIAALLLRLYNPTQGRILVDDRDLRELDPSCWRRLIGTVSQEPVLFSTSIRDNICYGAVDPSSISDAQIMEAARQSNALEFIQSFPQGFDTPVGETGGSMLSGGQKQRIAIARALVTNPELLIMDEATSALDATSEYLVRRALSRLLQNNKKTVIIIAHRLSTIKHADQIVVLEKGTVAELGTFDKLMGIENGVFRKLVEKQAIGWHDEEF